VTKTSEDIVQSAGGLIQEISFRIDDLSVGRLQYKGLILDVSNASRLGLGFLSRHIVTFDFSNSKIYLKKGKEFKKTDEADMSGLHLLRISNKTIVHSVDKNSPAEKAGIKANDIILSVGNKDANKYDMWKLRRLLKSSDKQKVTMTIKHGTYVKEVSFFLEKKI
jgi:membrane-associated protease RseP (regulator of RpoE activity)